MGEPLEDCQADELRAVVRAQEERSAMLADETVSISIGRLERIEPAKGSRQL